MQTFEPDFCRKCTLLGGEEELFAFPWPFPSYRGEKQPIFFLRTPLTNDASPGWLTAQAGSHALADRPDRVLVTCGAGDEQLIAFPLVLLTPDSQEKAGGDGRDAEIPGTLWKAGSPRRAGRRSSSFTPPTPASQRPATDQSNFIHYINSALALTTTTTF